MDIRKKDIAISIGTFFRNKMGEDSKQFIINLQIQDVDVNDDTVIIKTSRPGQLIGKRGERIDALSAYLNKKISVVEVDSITDWMLYDIESQIEDINNGYGE